MAKFLLGTLRKATLDKSIIFTVMKNTACNMRIDPRADLWEKRFNIFVLLCKDFF